MSPKGLPGVSRGAEWNWVADPGTGCWLWTGFIDKRGYGQTSSNARSTKMAHRMVYERFVGPIPEGLELDHLCRTPRCVRPEHLEPVAHHENMLRGFHATKTHCKHGHEFTTENTLICHRSRRPGPERVCRICAARRMAKHKRSIV